MPSATTCSRDASARSPQRTLHFRIVYYFRWCGPIAWLDRCFIPTFLGDCGTKRQFQIQTFSMRLWGNKEMSKTKQNLKINQILNIQLWNMTIFLFFIFCIFSQSTNRLVSVFCTVTITLSLISCKILSSRCPRILQSGFKAENNSLMTVKLLCIYTRAETFISSCNCCCTSKWKGMTLLES